MPEPQETTVAPSRRDNNFHALRLILALLVMVQHAPELVDGDRRRELLTMAFHSIALGDLAVDGFFVLSGYLIVQSWLRQPRLLDFLRKRILRIYPGFIVASLLCAFVFGPLGAAPATYFSRFSLPDFLQAALLLQPPVIPPVFQGQPYPLVNGSMWTIPYEFRFYLLVALFGILGLFRFRWLWLLMTVAGIALFAMISGVPNPSRYFPYSLGILGNTVYNFRFLAFFGAGGCFYLFREKIRYQNLPAILALIVAVLSLFRYDTAALALPTLGAYAFFHLGFKSIPWMRRIPQEFDISYGIYLYAWPVQKLILWYLPALSPWIALLIALPFTLAFGALSWLYVERPILRSKESGKASLQGHKP